ncbi:hypothetical protein BC940DRAFT_369013 [Gongronella butleri]|nr:hypothetical protein BC940DRAFT_369013 [Gongronella butleri]
MDPVAKDTIEDPSSSDKRRSDVVNKHIFGSGGKFMLKSRRASWIEAQDKQPPQQSQQQQQQQQQQQPPLQPLPSLQARAPAQSPLHIPLRQRTSSVSSTLTDMSYSWDDLAASPSSSTMYASTTSPIYIAQSKLPQDSRSSSPSDYFHRRASIASSSLAPKKKISSNLHAILRQDEHPSSSSSTLHSPVYPTMFLGVDDDDASASPLPPPRANSPSAPALRTTLSTPDFSIYYRQQKDGLTSNTTLTLPIPRDDHEQLLARSRVAKIRQWCRSQPCGSSTSIFIRQGGRTSTEEKRLVVVPFRQPWLMDDLDWVHQLPWPPWQQQQQQQQQQHHDSFSKNAGMIHPATILEDVDMDMDDDRKSMASSCVSQQVLTPLQTPQGPPATIGYLFSSAQRMGTYGRIHRPGYTIRSRLQTAKDACNETLRRVMIGLTEYVEHGLHYVDGIDEDMELASTKDEMMMMDDAASIVSNNDAKLQSCVTVVSEDDAYLPTPFILTLQDLIALAQEVLDTPVDALLDHVGHCARLVAKIQAIGRRWDDHQDWPCRGWYVHLLLSVAALNRVVEWWQEERAFWSTSQTQNDPPLHPTMALWDPMASPSAPPAPPPSLQQQHDHGRPIHPTNASIKPSEPPEKQAASRQLEEAVQRGQSNAIVMELTLHPPITIQYLSPVWANVIGSSPQELLGKPIHELVGPIDHDLFATASQGLLEKTTAPTVGVQFAICTHGLSVNMEGKGMLMHNRVTGEPSHTMWIIKPQEDHHATMVDEQDQAPSAADVANTTFSDTDALLLAAPNKTTPHTRSISAPTSDPPLFDTAGDADADDEQETADFCRRSLSMRRSISQGGHTVDDLSPSSSVLHALPPVLCRVCERWVVAAFFERHSELCVELHRTEMDIILCNDNLRDLKDVVMNDVQRVASFSASNQEKNDKMNEDGNNDDMDNDNDDDDASELLSLLPVDPAAMLDPEEQRCAEMAFYKDALAILDVALAIPVPRATQQLPMSFIAHDNSDLVKLLYWRPLPTDTRQDLARDISSVLKRKMDAVNRMRDQVAYIDQARHEFIRNNRLNDAWVEFVPEPLMDQDQNQQNQSNQSNPPIQESDATRLPPPVVTTAPIFIPPSSSSSSSSTPLLRRSRPSMNLPIHSHLMEMETIDTPLHSPSLHARLRPFHLDDNASISSTSSASPLLLPSKKQQNVKIMSASPSSLPKSPLHLTAPLSIDTNVPSVASSSPSSSNMHRMHPHHPLHPHSSPAAAAATAAAAIATTPSIKDYNIIKPISKGAFGSVYLAKKRVTGDYYAIKFLKKSDMIAKNQVTNVKAERMILMSQTDSPFVTKLYYTFQSKDYLYLVLEYLNGGDCSALIKAMGRLPENWARNYLAEVTLGLSYLYDKDIVHRDLKPDNLLIDQNGHLKLTDFGLSRIGFLDRRARDELKHGPTFPEPLPPSSPAPSRTNSPDPPSGVSSPHPPISSSVPSSPTLSATRRALPSMPPPSQPGNATKHYKHSFFGLLFDRQQQQQQHQYHQHGRRGSMASTSTLDGLSDTNNMWPADDRPIPPWHRPSSLAQSPSSASHEPGTLDLPSSPLTTRQPQTPQRHHAIGTPDYIAPESILGSGEDSMVDWWAMGVICYEFLFGYPPFNDDSPDKVFDNILSRRIDWHLGEDDVRVSPEAIDFMDRLLTLDPKKRLGAKGPDEVKQHPFFKGIHWATLLNDTPSFTPQITHQEDTTYFDPRGASMPVEEAQEMATTTLDDTTASTNMMNCDNDDMELQDEDNVDQGGGQWTKEDALLTDWDAKTGPRQGNDDDDDEDDEFGTFVYKNLPLLEKANEDTIRKIRHDSLIAQSPTLRGIASFTMPNSASTATPPPPSLVTASSSSSSSNFYNQNLPASPITPAQSTHSTHSALSSSPPIHSPSGPSWLHRFPAFSNSRNKKKCLSLHDTTHQHNQQQQQQQQQQPAPLTTTPIQPTPPRAIQIQQQQQSPSSSSSSWTSSLPTTPSRLSPSISAKVSTATNASKSSHLAFVSPSSSSSSPKTTSLSALSVAMDPTMTLHQPFASVTPLDEHVGRSRSISFPNKPPSIDYSHHTPPTAHPSHAIIPPTFAWPLASPNASAKDDQHMPLDCLLADDNPISCKILETILERMHCRCVIVRNGAQAIRYAMGNVKFDFIFMDIRMPIIDGEAAARMIKSSTNSNQHTPIIAITAYEPTVQLPHVFDALLSKPVTKEAIHAVFHHFKHIQAQQQQQQWQQHHQQRRPSIASTSSAPHNLNAAATAEQNTALHPQSQEKAWI